MPPTDFSAPVRDQRADLTDYVVHLTRRRPQATPFQVLMEILRSGSIRPTFAPYNSSPSGGRPRPAVKGPYPVVCLTEQPISVMVKTLQSCAGRYSGYGIAYYKPTLYGVGGRPVLYGSLEEIGRKLRDGESGWEEDKEVYTGGLPADLQYLFVRYDPVGIGPSGYKVDFTWEREWRVRFPNLFLKQGSLPVGLRNGWSQEQGAILVAKESEVAEVRSFVEQERNRDLEWPRYIGKIVSLEKAKERLSAGDQRYGRLETWPVEG